MISNLWPKLSFKCRNALELRLGNDYLLTDLSRKKSIFDLDVDLRQKVLQTLNSEGSKLSFVKSNCFWRIENLNSQASTSSKTTEANQLRPVKRVGLYFDLQAAKLMPLVLRYLAPFIECFKHNALS